MKITVQVSRSLSAPLGNHKITVELPAKTSMAGLLLQLKQDYPGFDDKLRGDYYNYFVNRKAVRPHEMESRYLRDGDRVHILVPVVGG